MCVHTQQDQHAQAKHDRRKEEENNLELPGCSVPQGTLQNHTQRGEEDKNGACSGICTLAMVHPSLLIKEAFLETNALV